MELLKKEAIISIFLCLAAFALMAADATMPPLGGLIRLSEVETDPHLEKLGKFAITEHVKESVCQVERHLVMDN